MKIYGRVTSSNVQKVMWSIAELGLDCERIDAGGAFGKNKEPDYLAKNPNGLVPMLEDSDGFILWESNSIVRYLAGKHDKGGVLEPRDEKVRAHAQMWMDWQLTTANPAIMPVFVGLIRTPPEQRDDAAIDAAKIKTVEAMTILDAQLAKTKFVAGDSFSYGDIPVGIMAYRFLQLVPEHPLPNLKRWYDAIASRQPFKKHVSAVPLS